MFQRCPLQKLHGDEGLGTMLADLVNGADAGMIQGRSRPRLPAESLQGLHIPGHIVGEELQGDEATEFSVLGLVHDTHTPTAKLLDDAVVGDGLTNHDGPTQEPGPC